MNAADSTPSPGQPAQVPATSAFTRRLCESVIGLLSGAFLGGIGGAVAFALVGSGLMLVSLEDFEPFIVLVWGSAGAIFGATCGALYGMLYGALVGAIWSLFGGPEVYGPKSVSNKWFICLILFGTVIGLIIYLWSDQAVNPPAPTEIQNMTVEFYPEKGERAKFSVSAEHIAKVLAPLAPARRDWYPAKWKHQGRLTIICKDGRITIIELYKARGTSFAFSVHPSDRSRNIVNYFRGGPDTALVEAIQNAHESSKSK